MKPTIGIIGAGKVGTVLARLLFNSGYVIASVYSRTESHAQQLADKVMAHTVQSIEEAISLSDLIIVAVPDDILEILFEYAQPDNQWNHKGIVHTSGVSDATVFHKLEKAGMWCGCLHPAFPFSDVEMALENLRGSVFAIEATNPVLQHWLFNLVNDLDGKIIEINPGKKALYHAAMVIASNYTVTLYAVSEKLLLEAGADRATADAALSIMMKMVAHNLEEKGIPWALTGPLTRADLGTIKRHIGVLYDRGVLLDVYKGLARLTYPLLEERSVSAQFIQKLEELFTSESDNHANDTP